MRSHKSHQTIKHLSPLQRQKLHLASHILESSTQPVFKMKYQTTILPIFLTLLNFAKAAPITSDTDDTFYPIFDPVHSGWGCISCVKEHAQPTLAPPDTDAEFFSNGGIGWGCIGCVKDHGRPTLATRDVDYEFEPQPEIGWGKRSPSTKDVDREFYVQPWGRWGMPPAEAAAKDTDEEFIFQPESGWGKRSA